MKTLISVGLCLIMLFSSVSIVFAVKPDGVGAVEVPWNLSGDVMPVPPYGSMDIPGSDTASKLIVNQPNGNTEVVITGVMNGLLPNTSYTVYPSKGYTPYKVTGWDVEGSYTLNLTVGSTPYIEYLVLTQDGGELTGQSLALNPEQTSSRWNIDSGSVIDNVITINAHFGTDTSMKLIMEGTIATDGSMSGTWHDVGWNTRSGIWSTTAGHATKTFTGNQSWPGLFPGQSTFTFVTDEYGSGSWHLNLKNEDFLVSGEYILSVWINNINGKTILISNNFTVIVE